MLAAQGLVTIVPRAGMFVHQPTAAELVAMFETLAEMEGVVARLATQRITAAGKKVLANAHEAAAEHVERGDTAGYIEANRKFHDVLYQAAANPFLSEQIVQLRRRLAIYWQKKGLDQRRPRAQLPPRARACGGGGAGGQCRRRCRGHADPYLGGRQGHRRSRAAGQCGGGPGRRAIQIASPALW